MGRGRWLLVAVALVATANAAVADVVVSLDSYSYISASHVWRYTYEIDNSEGSEYVWFLELDYVDEADITGFATGWSDIFEDTSIGGYVSWSATETSYWVSPGWSLSGFVVESPWGPVTASADWYVSTDADGSEGGATGYAEGYVDGPQVPEPATWLLLAAGVGAIAARRRKGTHGT